MGLMVLSRVLGAVSSDVGIDLGTANTRACVKGKGLIFDEPSVVAVKRGTNKVLSASVGLKAKEMIGRTPESIDVILPLQGGVVTDFDMTGALLAHVIQRVPHRRRWLGPRLLINAPSGITPVEKRALFNAAERAGARKIYLVEGARAAGLGAGLPIHEAKGCMIVDVGAGTTDVSILSLGDVVISESIKIAGDAMDDAIVKYLQRNYNMLIGQNTAEEIKIRVGSASESIDNSEASIDVKGRDFLAHVPRRVTVTSEEVREALTEPVNQIVELIRMTLEKTGPELSGDLLDRGMVLCGGGVLLRGLSEVIYEETGLAVRIADRPLETVSRGTQVFIEHLDEFAPILESAEDDL